MGGDSTVAWAQGDTVTSEARDMIGYLATHPLQCQPTPCIISHFQNINKQRFSLP